MKISKLLLVFCLLLVFGALFVPRPHVANDLHYLFQPGLGENFSLPKMFTDFEVGNGFGERTVISAFFWPIKLVFAVVSKLGISFSYGLMLLAFVPLIILGAVGIYRLLAEYKIGNWGRVAGTLFFLVNTYLLLLVDGGQINLALTYTLLPWAFLYISRALEKPSLGSFGKAFLPVWGISVFDPRILLILAVLLFVKFLADVFFKKIRLKTIRNYFLWGLFTGVFLLGLHFYWILPAWFVRGGSVLPPTYARTSQVSFLSFVDIGHSLTLEAPHWYKNVFGKVIPLEARYFLIPILVFLAPILRRRDKNLAFWLVVAAIGIFLAKGSNPPLGNIYTWIFANVPGFSLFRDPTKFFFLTAISFSVLIGTTIDEVENHWGWNLRFNGHRASVVSLLVMLYFLLLAAPVYTGKMTGLFAKPIYQKESFALADKLASDKDFGRILWIPTITPLGFASPTHPQLDAANVMNLRPFASAVAGTYETFNFLRAPYIDSLLDIAGVKYVIYPYPDTRREELKKDNIAYYYWFLNKLTSADWAANSSTNSAAPVVEVKKHEDKFFMTPNTFWIIGSDGIYSDIPSGALAANALVFAEEIPGVSSRLSDFSNAKVILYGKSETDLAASFLGPSQYIFPAKSSDFSPGKTGWWKREVADLISWRGFLQEKYGIDNRDFDYSGGWAVAEGERQLRIDNSQLKNGNQLLVRAMQSSRGGKIEFFQGDKSIGTIDTLLKDPKKVQVGDKEYHVANVGWFEVGRLAGNQPLTVKTSGDINVVNIIAVLSQEDWNRANREASVLVNQNRVFEWDKLGANFKTQLFQPSQNGRVSYERVSSTHYRVTTEGLKEPAVLAFSETFDPLWQVNGKEPVELYSLINGFYIETDGIYEVYFAPQKYVIPGLIVFALASAFFIGLAVFRRK